MKRWLLCLVTICSILTLVGQNNCSLKGKMVDSLSHDALEFVRVGLVTNDSLQKNIGIGFTAKDGNFVIENVPEGSYLLKAFLMGYDNLSMPIKITSSSTDLGLIALKKQSQQLEGVTIAAQKPLYLFDGEKTLYNVSEDPMVQDGNASDALQNAPGVEVDVEGNITLRGVSSVEIWINNKPSNMNEAALKNFIQQMPAGSIETIEVITNPSARYSAKGKGGIINIVTNTKIKKNSFFSFGVNGSSTPLVTPWISYVWANEKWSVSVYAKYTYSHTKYNFSQIDTMYNEAHELSNIFANEGKSLYKMHSGGIFLNGSCIIDTANSIYFWAGGYPQFHRSIGGQNSTREEFLNAAGLYDYATNEDTRQILGGCYGGLWYTHQFNNEGHNISASLNGNFHESNNKSLETRTFQGFDHLNFDKKKASNYLSGGVNGSVDYTIPYHKNGEIEIGTDLSYSNSKDWQRYDTLVSEIKEYQIDSLRYKDAQSQDIGWDFYTTIQHRFGKFVIKAGLRSEYIHFDWRYFNSPTHDGAKSYWGLYPSLHLSYSTKSMDNFKLSYTRRVNNPSSAELTTFIDYSDDALSSGNPKLRPNYTNVVEAGWTRFIPKFGNLGVTAFFNYSKDEFSYLSDIIYDEYFGRVVEFSTMINAGKSLNTGCEFNMTYQLKAFMSLRFYARLNYTKSQFLYRNDTYDIDNLGYSFRLNFWAKAWKILEINLSANYKSKSKSLFVTTLPTYSIDAGLRIDLCKQMLSLHANVNNIFNWNKNSNISTNPFYYTASTITSSWSGRSFSLGIKFRFGRLELESRSAQNSAPSQGMM